MTFSGFIGNMANENYSRLKRSKHDDPQHNLKERSRVDDVPSIVGCHYHEQQHEQQGYDKQNDSACHTSHITIRHESRLSPPTHKHFTITPNSNHNIHHTEGLSTTPVYTSNRNRGRLPATLRRDRHLIHMMKLSAHETST